MVGLGMIFDETYRPFFESAARAGIYDPAFGVCDVRVAAVATRTGRRAAALASSRTTLGNFANFQEPNSIGQLLATDVDFVCVATPDDRHFAAAKAALAAGKHVLIEKPSVLSLAELDELERLAREQGVLAKVVYHKLLDPDHKKLRTLVADGELRHVNNGYCTLLEPKSISGGQFAEWITGRNPGTYVAVHYIKLIDFTFGGRLSSVACTGQRGLVGAGRRADLGFDAIALDLRLRRRPRGGFRYSHQLGHARQFSRLCRAGSAISLRQWRVERAQPQARRGMHGRRADAARAQNHDEQPLQRHVPRTLAAAVAARLRSSRCWSDSCAKWRPSSLPDRPRRAMAACKRLVTWITMTSRPIGRPWPRCRRWKRFWPGMPPASQIASSRVDHPAGGLVLLRPGKSELEILYAGRRASLTANTQSSDRHEECEFSMAHVSEFASRSRASIEHRGEEQSNAVRRRAAAVEPSALRTFTPTLAVIDRSAGSYHWTPEGRMLADFSSGVLVANLGHNPARWWRRVIEYLGMWDFKPSGEFFPAAPLTAYNAITELDTHATRAIDRSCCRVSPAVPGASKCCGRPAAAKRFKRRYGRARSPAGGGHDSGHALRISWQEGIGRRGDRQRKRSRARSARAVHWFPARGVRNLELRGRPLDLAPYIADLVACRKEFGERIACLITEPYLGGGGSFHPQKEYLQAARAILPRATTSSSSWTKCRPISAAPVRSLPLPSTASSPTWSCLARDWATACR